MYVWTHAGAYTSLEAVIRHHLDPVESVNSYDATQVTNLQEDIRNTDKILTNTEEALEASSFFRQGQQAISLNKKQIGFLVEFLQSLTDPCTQDSECLSQWIPDANNANMDQLNAYDQNGDAL